MLPLLALVALFKSCNTFFIFKRRNVDSVIKYKINKIFYFTATQTTISASGENTDIKTCMLGSLAEAERR